MAQCRDSKSECELHSLINSNKPTLLAAYLNTNYDFSDFCYIAMKDTTVLPVDFTQKDMNGFSFTARDLSTSIMSNSGLLSTSIMSNSVLQTQKATVLTFYYVRKPIT
ncbi:hypothetical protein DPMN_099243 [Dreissena polymorpha]|uniref:Uncharacterized protein n=1 Tax=Dreissena polymorpha TaxID=45954 RepID=A0A9D4R686_DREPO|nr:hypothetical protein DPMN_099243 [Dreissena polymorpha]